MVVNSRELILSVFISVMVPAKHINFPAKKFFFALVVLSLIKPAIRKKVFLSYFYKNDKKCAQLLKYSQIWWKNCGKNRINIVLPRRNFQSGVISRSTNDCWKCNWSFIIYCYRVYGPWKSKMVTWARISLSYKDIRLFDSWKFIIFIYNRWPGSTNHLSRPRFEQSVDPW